MIALEIGNFNTTMGQDTITQSDVEDNELSLLLPSIEGNPPPVDYSTRSEPDIHMPITNEHHHHYEFGEIIDRLEIVAIVMMALIAFVPLISDAPLWQIASGSFAVSMAADLGYRKLSE